VGLTFRRWGVFNLVASGGLLIQLGAIALLTRKFGWPPGAAAAVGVELAALHNFVGHCRWTWSDYPIRTARSCARRYLRYQFAKTASLGANVAITAMLVAVARLPVEAASVLAVAACALPNYLLIRKSFTFVETMDRNSTRPAMVTTVLRYLTSIRC
jgi:putative flippase GtrA